MRKIFILIIVTSLIVSCNTSDHNKDVTRIDLNIDSNKIRIDEAKVIIDEVNEWMKKGIKKSISKEKVNEEINPLMEKYQSLLEKMNERDSTEIQDYRIEKINELIDFQLQQN